MLLHAGSCSRPFWRGATVQEHDNMIVVHPLKIEIPDGIKINVHHLHIATLHMMLRNKSSHYYVNLVSASFL